MREERQAYLIPVCFHRVLKFPGLRMLVIYKAGIDIREGEW